MGVLSCYCSNLGLTHYNLVIQIFRYLFGTLDLGITFTANSKNNLVGYTDFNYAELIDGQKSIGDYIFMLSGGPLSYQSKLQSIVALLLTKAKYMVITKAEKKALWVAQFLTYLGFCLPSQPVNLCMDNKGAISLIKNPKFYWKTKYIKVRWHWI